jgi:hypothetical protein
MKKPVLCVDCKWSDQKEVGLFFCENPKNFREINPVTGERVPTIAACDAQRWGPTSTCGARGRWFEPKPDVIIPGGHEMLFLLGMVLLGAIAMGLILMWLAGAEARPLVCPPHTWSKWEDRCSLTKIRTSDGRAVNYGSEQQRRCEKCNMVELRSTWTIRERNQEKQ